MAIRCLKYFLLYLTFPVLLTQCFMLGFWWSGRVIGYDTFVSYASYGTRCNGQAPVDLGRPPSAIQKEIASTTDLVRLVELKTEERTYRDKSETYFIMMYGVSILQIFMIGLLGFWLYHFASKWSARFSCVIKEAGVYFSCFLLLFPLDLFFILTRPMIKHWFGFYGTEKYLSEQLTGYGWLLPLLLTVTGVTLLLTINIRRYLWPVYIPISILCGCVTGALLWMNWVGKWVMG